MESINYLSEHLLTGAVYIGLYTFLFLLAKWAKDFFTPYCLNQELAEHDNMAVSLTMSGYYLALTLIYSSLLSSSDGELQTGVINVTAYSLLGLLALNLSRWINDKAILRSFCNIEKLTKEQDNGVGIIQFAVYLATGLIAAGAVTGEGNMLTFISFFVLGQVCLILFTFVYRLVAPFDLYEQLEKHNLSAAIAFAGTLLAFGIVVMNSVSGDFVSWQTDLLAFALSAVVAFVFIPLLQWATDRLVIPGKSLRQEIVAQQSLSAGVLEASVAVSFALVLVRLF